MPREAKAKKLERAAAVCARLHERYPAVQSALDYTDAFTLLIAVMLSAQTTDAAVNKVTPRLFASYPDAFALAKAPLADVEDILKSIGFFRSKAAHAIEAAQIIVSEHAGQVPSTMEELTALPGVGRKTANIVLNKAFNICLGIAVDTHVYRIATRLKFTSAPTPKAAEADLLALIDPDMWTFVNEEWIHFGREICSAQSPKCENCPLVDLCPSAFKVNGNPRPKKRRSSKKN